MNHLVAIQTEFIGLSKTAVESEWWKKLSPEEQRQYILQHRKTKLRPQSRPHSVARSILTKIPKDWKKKLVLEQIGENSEFTQLSDKVRPRELKSAFSEQGVKAIVGFTKSDVTSSELKPAFLITPSGYQDNKFRAYTLAENEESKDIVKKKDRYRRSRYGGSWTETIHDLRITAISESIPDKPYLIYAIKMDEERLKTRQERSSLKEVSKRRDIEKKLIADIAKPIYDYYDENLQTYIKRLQESAMPSFDKIIQGEHKSIDGRVIEKINEANSKIGSLASTVNGFKYSNLTSQDEPYSKDRYDRQSFMRRLKEFKEQFAKQYNLACQRRIKYVADSIKNNDYADAIFQLDLIKQKDLANELKQIVYPPSLGGSGKNIDIRNEIDEFLIKLSGAQQQLRDEFSQLERQ